MLILKKKVYRIIQREEKSKAKEIIAPKKNMFNVNKGEIIHFVQDAILNVPWKKKKDCY